MNGKGHKTKQNHHATQSFCNMSMRWEESKTTALGMSTRLICSFKVFCKMAIMFDKSCIEYTRSRKLYVQIVYHVNSPSTPCLDWP